MHTHIQTDEIHSHTTIFNTTYIHTYMHAYKLMTFSIEAHIHSYYDLL
jgi:hypothetical protein